jgi:hypothetical protein
MGEAANQIENYIDTKRGDLGSNIQELEQKVRSVTNWREQFQKNPMTMVGVAFGGGILLASMLGGRPRHRNGASGGTVPHADTDRQTHNALETWDSIKGALIGVAATRFKDFVGEVVPGFHEQFQKTEMVKRSSPAPAEPS